MKRWETWFLIAGALNLLFFETGGYWSATWLSKWAALIGMAVGCFSIWAARKTSWFYFPLILYVFASLLGVALWTNPNGSEFDLVTLMAMQKNAFYGLVVWAACVSGFALVKKSHATGALAALSSIWLIGTVSILLLPLSGMRSPPNNGLWFGNPSMGASLLACLLPFAWAFFGQLYMPYEKIRLKSLFVMGSWLATFAMIYRTRTSVPWGVLGVVTAAVFIARAPKKARFRAVCGIGIFAFWMIATGKLLLGKEFWDHNGRFEIWRMAYDYLVAHGHPSVGFGFATSQIMLPIEQLTTNNFKGDYFLWLHNDWLQIFVEGGWVGSTCALLAFARLMVSAWARPALFGSLMGFAVLALFNYPLRMPIHSFCMVLIAGLAEAYATRSVEKKSETLATVAQRTSSMPA